MNNQTEELRIPTIQSIQMLLEPIKNRLSDIEQYLRPNQETNSPKGYYRNTDLKRLFGLSSNTIIKYRETGVLPYTSIGDIYYYEIKIIENILKRNSVSLYDKRYHQN